MYSASDYLKRGFRFANNITRPKHKKIATLMLYGTELCDSACKHCLIWAKRPAQHLSFEKIVEIMNSKCVSKDTLVGLEGGEFLLHPEADKILDWFSKNHPNYDMLSNCLKPEKVIEAVKKYTPNRLYISLDGTKETYHRMRGKDGYDSVIRVIEELKDIVPISTMFTLSPYNDFDDLRHVINVCKKHDVDVRIGIYNDIDLFDTVDKAHETEISSHKEEEAISYSQVKEELHAKSEEKRKTLKDQSDICNPKHNPEKLHGMADFQHQIPDEVKETSENYDFMLLYDEWRKKNTKLKCHSILDSIVIHPNGEVPICQNLGVHLGNVNEKSLDEIFNSKETVKLQKHYVHNCNQCWINFHRKYDIVILRTLEKFIPKKLIEVVYGKYQWSESRNMTYKKFMKQFDK